MIDPYFHPRCLKNMKAQYSKCRVNFKVSVRGIFLSKAVFPFKVVRTRTDLQTRQFQSLKIITEIFSSSPLPLA